MKRKEPKSQAEIAHEREQIAKYKADQASARAVC